jgi:hypothetical protein
LNVGLKFLTPEQHFLKQDLGENYTKNVGFDPKSMPKSGPIFKGETGDKLVKPSNPESKAIWVC